MDGSVGVGQGQGPLPDFGKAAEAKVSENQPFENIESVFHLEKAPQDEITKSSESTDVQLTASYSASQQHPKLAKPFENEKMVEAALLFKKSLSSNAPLSSIKVGEKGGIADEKPVNREDTSDASETASIDETSAAASGSEEVHAPPKDALQLYENTSVILQEMYDAQSATVAGMPAGAEKARYIDFLAKVNEALISFQKLLQSLMAEDSKGARDRSKAQLEASLNKIEKQKDEREEIEEKQKKADKKENTMKSMTKTFGVFGVIMLSAVILISAPMLLSTPPAGWMVLALLVISLVDNCQKLSGQTEGTAWTGVMDGFDTMTKDMAGVIADIPGVDLSESQMAALETGIKFTMVVTMMCVMISACPMAFTFTPNAFTEFLENSGSITEIVKESGGSDKQAQNAELYTGLAITCVAMITGIAASFVCPAGIGGAVGGIAEKAGNLAKSAAQMLARALQAAIKISDAAARMVTVVFTAIFKALLDPQFWLSVSMLTLQGVNTDASVKYYTLMSDIQLIQAQLEGEVESKDALIAILKQAIKKLLESMDSLGKDIASISNLLQSNREGLGEVLSNLYG